MPGSPPHPPTPSALPEDAGTCREEERPRRPAMGLGETKSRVRSPSPSPSRAPVRAARSTCSRRAHLGLRPPASPRWVAWGGAGRERGGLRRAAGRRGEGAAGGGAGSRARPSAADGETGARALDPDPGGGGRERAGGGGERRGGRRRSFSAAEPEGPRLPAAGASGGIPWGSRQGLAPSSQRTHLPRPPAQPPGDRSPPGRG